MLSKDKINDIDDLDFIKSIQAVRKYINYGVSSYKDSEDRLHHYKLMQNKIKESQDTTEDTFDIIELVMNKKDPKRARGELFEKKQVYKNEIKKTRKKSINLLNKITKHKILKIKLKKCVYNIIKQNKIK